MGALCAIPVAGMLVGKIWQQAGEPSGRAWGFAQPGLAGAGGERTDFGCGAICLWCVGRRQWA